ncbi:MAG: hypothetical protein WBB65_07375 [Anaerolineales bacterium]
MTQYARLVLKDCEAAMQDLQSGAIGHTYRSRWVGAVALLRTVGHVLDKRDKLKDEWMATAIDNAWSELKQTKPEPRIFWEFIEEERNNVLKLYEFGAKENITVRPGAISINLDTGEQVSSPSGETTYDHFVAGGPLEGFTPDEAVAQAIEWWCSYLDRVDREATEARKAST